MINIIDENRLEIDVLLEECVLHWFCSLDMIEHPQCRLVVYCERLYHHLEEHLTSRLDFTLPFPPFLKFLLHAQRTERLKSLCSEPCFWTDHASSCPSKDKLVSLLYFLITHLKRTKKY